MSTQLRKVRLTVINDLICPNCFIGQHELLAALSEAENVLHLPLSFEIQFLPYRLISTKCLNEDMPKVQKAVFFEKKLGKANFEAIKTAAEKWSADSNVPINFAGVMSQSTRAHRLSWKAYLVGGQEKQLPVLCSLSKAFLQDGKDIADFEVLADIATSTGLMSRDEALQFLQSNELADEIEKMIEEAKVKGISGVPLIVVDGKWAVTGGQAAEVFVQIFKKLADGPSTSQFVPPKPLETDILAQPVQQVC